MKEWYMKLNSVSTAIDTKKLIAYPILTSGNIAFDMGVHIADIDDEWWDNLSYSDRMAVEGLEVA